MTLLDILVTGHTGFIGSALMAHLNGTSLSWRGISRSTGHDLTDPSVLDHLPNAKWIIHLAGRAAILESWQKPHEFFRANHDATLHVLEHARRTGAHVLYMSSYMYGVPQYLPIDEAHPVSCRNPYAWSKRAGELLCEAYHADFKVPVTLLRPFNVYGPGQPNHQLMPYLVAQAMEGDTISLADLEPKRDWLWIGDLVSAMLAIVTKSSGKFDIFNVGYGESKSVVEIVDEVVAQLGPRKIVCRNEVRRNEIPDCVCDARRFMSEFSWAPTTSLSEGVAQIVQSWQSAHTKP